MRGKNGMITPDDIDRTLTPQRGKSRTVKLSDIAHALTPQQLKDLHGAQDPKKSKWKNVRGEYDGIKFDSIGEVRRYRVLKTMEAAGEISDLKVHPVFILQESFIDAEGYRHPSITYEADFSYYDLKSLDSAGRPALVVEDIKGAHGTMTPVFMLKAKMFLKQYVSIRFRIIKPSGERIPIGAIPAVKNPRKKRKV